MTSIASVALIDAAYSSVRPSGRWSTIRSWAGGRSRRSLPDARERARTIDARDAPARQRGTEFKSTWVPAAHLTLPHALIEGPLTWPGQHGGFLGLKFLQAAAEFTLDPLANRVWLGGNFLYRGNNFGQSWVKSGQAMPEGGRVSAITYPSHDP